MSGSHMAKLLTRAPDDEVPGCTPACWTQVDCTVCRMRKKPSGRDVGAAAANGYCDHECPGYWQAPHPPHLWHENDSARAYMDPAWAAAQEQRGDDDEA